MKKLSIFLIMTLFAVLTRAATITVSGPTFACPSVSYSYTASATNIFGPQKGCFFLTFKVNGVAVGYAGGIQCPCSTQNTSYTTNFTWPSTGNFQVAVSFKPFNVPGCDYSYGSLSGVVRTVAPERVFDSDGGFSFCTPGQTRTIMVPTIPYNNTTYCNWHHAYDYIPPAGWTVTPIPPFDPQEVVNLPGGGIRTHATAVFLRAPATPLLPGFSGNYVMTVRTEPAWPFPKEITRQIWIGTYGGAATISGTSAVCPGNTYTYTATPPGGQQIPGHIYSWTQPSGWTIQSQAQNYITLYVPQFNPSYGPVQFTVNNGCGNSANGLTTFPGYGCPNYMLSVFPNPTQEELTIEITNEDKSSNPETVNIQEAKLINSSGETVLSSRGAKKKISFNVRNLRRGQYFLHVKIGDQLTKEQIIIN